MGGKIEVQSELNRGTIFSVHLPASCVRACAIAQPRTVYPEQVSRLPEP
jgi:hypothetical protein